MKVKSRRMRPWLNTSIGRPASTARENSSGAMSGRPQGPYTVKKRRPVAAKKTNGKARPQADIVALERELSEALGTRVGVLHGRGGKGRLVIHYHDLDSLEGVLERLRTKQE